MDDFFGLPTTLILLSLAILTFVFLVRLEKRPAEFGKVRLIPPTFLLIVCSVVILVLVARLLSEIVPHPFK